MALDLHRWPHADALLDEALALPCAERRPFVRRAAGDPALAEALERVLFEADNESDGFLPQAGALTGPLVELLRETVDEEGARLSVGDTPGGYRVLGHLGRGGMGEVYRARDDSLARDVALKILPTEVAGDPTRLARFRREARLLASLNHPNVGGIYHVIEDGDVLALVLELVEGPTLAERLATGPLAVGEALSIARQVGDAVAAAHQAGVVHRDLKPANIKITPAGVVKVLDFGIAKAVRGDHTSGTDADLTFTEHGGAAVGTAAYMSPEQARGEPVDHRTDIWAFACVIYEMLTARRAFEGQSTTEVLARVLEREPDFTRLPRATPDALHRLLRRAFEKEPGHRLGYMGDALLEIEDADDVLSSPAQIDAAANRRLWRAGSIAAVGLVTGIAIGALWVRPRATTSAPPVRVIVPVPDDHEVVVGQLPALAVSRNGRVVVYRARQGGVMRLFRRSLDGADAIPLKGTDDVAGHALSPDGEYLAFVRDGQIYKMPVEGGTPAAIGTIAGGAALSWGTPDTIVLAGGPGNTLKRLSASGGAVEAVTALDTNRGELSHGWPELLPDGRTVLFTIMAQNGHQLAVTTIGSNEPPAVLTSGRQPRLLPSGLLVFARDRDLWAGRFDSRAKRFVTEPQSVLEGIERSGLNGFVHFAVSDAGTLVYIPFRDRAGMRVVDWVDRAGRPAGTELERRGITRFALSPDETRLAVAIADGDERDIWVIDRDRGATTRLTTDRGTETQPVWSPDGHSLAYRADHDGGGVFLRSADGAAPPRRLTTPGDAVDIPYAFSADGTHLLFTRFRDYTDQDILSVAVGGGEPKTILAERFAEMRPALSPDGRWLLYQADQSGRLEVYLRPYPEVTGGRWPVSTNGGTSPAWRADGAELYFVEGTILQAVRFGGGESPRLGPPRALVDLGPSDDRLGSEFDVSADGSRLLVLRDAPGSAARAEMRLVLNWVADR